MELLDDPVVGLVTMSADGQNSAAQGDTQALGRSLSAGKAFLETWREIWVDQKRPHATAKARSRAITPAVSNRARPTSG